MNEMPQCIGCGTLIQTEDKNGLGYAPQSSLEKETIICQRCFRLKRRSYDAGARTEKFVSSLSAGGGNA